VQDTKPRQTVKEWLDELANSSESTEQDSAMMQNLLHRVGFSKAVVVCGIVYLEGKGTLYAPPTDLHTIARMLIEGE